MVEMINIVQNRNDLPDLLNDFSNMSFEETVSILKDKDIQFKTCDTIDSLYLLSDASFNGLILEKGSNMVVCMSERKFKKIETQTQQEQINEIKNNYDDIKVEYCEDGTVIRLYNYKDVWYTATSKCLDAKKSHWGSNKSFDEMFWESMNDSQFYMGLENGLESLDKNYTYFFILLHTENRIVIKHENNSLIYIKRICNTTYQEDNTNTEITQLSIDYDQITAPLDSLFINTKRGILLKCYKLGESCMTYETYQYDFKNYTEVKTLRGNSPFIRTRILELLEDQENLELLKYFYSEYILSFAMVEHSLNKLYSDIHKLYIESHIKHNIQIYETHPLYKTLKQLHGQYKTRILENPEYIITIDEVKSKVNKLNQNILGKLLGWVA